MKTDTELRIFIVARIMSRIDRPGARRTEALRELISVVMPHLDTNEVDALVQKTPEIPSSLYEKWSGLFADRMLNTVPREQIEYLCANTEESNAALLLLYSMFMESQTMEKIMAEDMEDLLYPSRETCRQ